MKINLIYPTILGCTETLHTTAAENFYITDADRTIDPTTIEWYRTSKRKGETHDGTVVGIDILVGITDYERDDEPIGTVQTIRKLKLIKVASPTNKLIEKTIPKGDDLPEDEISVDTRFTIAQRILMPSGEIIYIETITFEIREGQTPVVVYNTIHQIGTAFRRTSYTEEDLIKATKSEPLTPVPEKPKATILRIPVALGKYKNWKAPKALGGAELEKLRGTDLDDVV
jgi:hypothetical protein